MTAVTPSGPVDDLLAARGLSGEVVNIGHAPELNEPVYLVQFDGCVVGCLEIELVWLHWDFCLKPRNWCEHGCSSVCPGEWSGS